MGMADRPWVIRNIEPSDADILQTFVSKCPPLDPHTLFTYWVLARYQPTYGFAAQDLNGEVIGLLTAIASSNNDETVYVWQIGVAPAVRGNGLAQDLLHELNMAALQNRRRLLEVSIDSHNQESYRLFHAFARAQSAALEVVDVLELHDEHYSLTDSEFLYQIRLSGTAAPRQQPNDDVASFGQTVDGRATIPNRSQTKSEIGVAE
jgi:L-2,4-diaminobutyric acid acetyltransferase